MSYLRSPSRARAIAARRRPRPLSRRALGDAETDWFAGFNLMYPSTWWPATVSVFGSSVEGAAGPLCSDQAAAAVAPFDAYIADITSSTLGPLYSAAQMNMAIGAVMNLVNQAGNLVLQTKAVYDTSDLDAAAESLVAIGQRSLTYLGYVSAQGISSTTAFEADDFQQWAIDAMQAWRDAAYKAAYAACSMPWYLSAILTFQPTFDAVYSVLKSIAAAAITVAATIIKIPTMLGTLLTYAGYAAVAAGVVYLIWGNPFAKKRIASSPGARP